VDLSEAIRLWPLAVNMLACHVAGLGLGWLTVKTLKVPASLTSQVMVMTAMGNIGRYESGLDRPTATRQHLYH
jgi:hypothetical protein